MSLRIWMIGVGASVEVGLRFECGFSVRLGVEEYDGARAAVNCRTCG